MLFKVTYNVGIDKMVEIAKKKILVHRRRSIEIKIFCIIMGLKFEHKTLSIKESKIFLKLYINVKEGAKEGSD